MTRAKSFLALAGLLIVAGCGGSSKGSVDHTVTAVAGAGGSISPAASTVDDGATASFTVTVEPGHRIGTVSGCGGTLSGSTYTTGAVTADCTVTASFVVTHTVTAVAGAGGSISPAASTVDDVAMTTFTVTADAGYLASASGCGGTLSGSTYTTGAITADCAVTASFGAVGGLGLTPQSVKTFHFTWPEVSGATEYRLLEDPDGASGYTEVASITAATSYDLEVSLPRRINARYALRACNGGGCADSASVAVPATLANAAGYVKASNAGGDDYFGWAVALSSDGNTLAVGAALEDSAATGVNGDQSSDSASQSGAAYVFTRSGGSWSQQAYVKASNTGAYDGFGWAVALSSDGNILAVGAAYEDSAATGVGGDQSSNSASESGAVYVFTRSGGSWSQQAYVKASNNGGGDYFGLAVALSSDGNTLAVGARNEASAATGVGGDQSSNSASGSGAVYVFTQSGGSWSQQAYVKASNTEGGDEFGHAVALSSDGNTLAVGAVLEGSAATGVNGDQSSDVASGSGAVYVFTRSGGSWSQQAYVKASNTGAGDEFGYAVALSSDGNTLAVGARDEASAATGVGGDQSSDAASGSGAVYVFTRSVGAWSQQAYVKASNTGAGDEFGYAVALSSDGNTLAVGARDEASAATGVGGDQSSNSASESGAVYLY